ncbi:MAG: carboxyl-terminal processing protease, partial [Sphingobacteriales bacterium]
MSQRKVNILLPLVLASILALGMFLGTKMNPSSTPTVPTKSIFNFSLSKYEKIKRVLDIIDGNYVDTVNVSKLEEEGIYAILKELDPHSAYYTAEQLTRSNEDLQGNFEGVGIEFYILEDTILVVTAIPGGPSDDLGIMSGDKIIKIEQDTVAGSGIKNSDVIKSLRGPKGTEVNVSIMRSGKPKLIEFAIKRGKIPLNSMDVVYMVDENTGYMKFNKFSATTQREMIKGLDSLNSLGMKDLILDLRGNPGGYLTAAIA